jgi:hypothetical protein
MGNLFSGNRTKRIDAKLATHELPRVSIKAIAHEIDHPLQESINVSLQRIYANNGKVKTYRRSHTFQLTWSKCNYGSHRPWFVCPECGARVGVLYGVAISDDVRCRKCCNMNYYSQQRTKKPRQDIEQRLFKLKRKLKCSIRKQINVWYLPSISDKPKGMSYKKFDQICDRIYQEQLSYINAFDSFMSKLPIAFGVTEEQKGQDLLSMNELEQAGLAFWELSN